MATLAPSQAIISSVGAAINGGNANSTKPVITGTADVGTTVNIYDGVRFLGAVTVGPTGTWTYTPTADLKGGTHSFTAIAMSSTGVNGVSSEPMSVTVASSAPAKPIVSGLTDDNNHAITSPTNDPRPNMSGTGTPNDIITMYDGSTPVGSTTVNQDGTWSLKPTSDLPNGTNDIYVIETKPTGGTGTPSDHFPVVIDTHVPATPAAPALKDDSGATIAAGSTSADAHPNISGTGTANDIIKVYDGANVIGSVKIGPDGTWSFKPTTDLSNGTHDLYVTETTPAGTASAASPHTAITVNTSVPATPAAPVANDDSNNVIPAGSTTADAHPTLSGTGTAGDIIKVYDGSNVIGSVKIGPDGTWSFKPTTDLSNGTHDLYVTETTPAGTASAASPHTAITVNTSVPSTPVAPVAKDDSNNVIPAGSTTADAHPTLSGTGTANDIIKVYDGANLIGSVAIGSDGKWSFKPSTDLSTGVTHNINVTESNLAGATSAHSPNLALTVDTYVPPTPQILYLTSAANFNIPNGTTYNEADPYVTGYSRAGDIITMYEGSTALGSVVVPAGGVWKVQPASNLAGGAHTFYVIETTPAGTTSAHSNTFGYTYGIDTPLAPTITDAGMTIPSGSTMPDGHPSISGSGKANDTIKVYDGANLIGSTTIDLDGHWTFTPTTALTTGSVHSISVVETNGPSAASAQSPATLVTVSNVAPTITSLNDNVGPVTGSVANGGATDDLQPTVSGTGIPGYNVFVDQGGGVFTTALVDPTGHWSLVLRVPLSLGSDTLTAVQQFGTSPSSAASDPWHVTVYSSTISTPAVPTISDGGNVISSGGTMADGHPTITGSGTVGDTIKVYDGANVIGSTTVGPDGHWSFTPTTDLATGSAHSISVVETNPAGATSAQSGSTSVTVSNGAPVITSLYDAVGSVTGYVPNGGATDDLQPHITGTGIPGYSVLIYTNGHPYNGAVVDKDGNWSVDLRRAVDLGFTTITAAQYLGSGAYSAMSAPWYITFYTDSVLVPTPAAPVITDGGVVIPSGGSMPDGHPLISGIAVAGNTIRVYDGANLIGVTTVGQTGLWSFTPTTDLSTGSSHSISVIQLTSAGTASLQSAATTVTVGGSLAVPATPATPATPTLTDDTNTAIAGGSTFVDGHPHINGTGTVGDVIKVYDGSTVIGSTTVNSSGKWTFTPSTDLTVGAHAFSVTETNSAGTSAKSGNVAYTYSTTYSGPVMITSVTNPAVGSIPFGGSTTDTQPVVGGVGIPGYNVTFNVYVAGSTSPLGGTNALLVDGTGHWSAQIRVPMSAGSYYFEAFQSPVISPGVYGPPSALSAPWNVTITSGVSQTLSATHDDATSATVLAAVADASTSTAQADHHTTVGEHDTFVGHVINGNETVDLNVDPTVYFKQATAHIEGAKGVAIDTLHLTGDHQVLDLTSLTGQTAAAKISGIEVVDLGGHTNTVKLSLVDVLNLGETDLFQTDGKQQMMVKGSAGDSVDLSNSHIAGLAEGEWQAHGTTQVGGVTYNVYEHSGVHTELLVQQGVQIVVH